MCKNCRNVRRGYYRKVFDENATMMLHQKKILNVLIKIFFINNKLDFRLVMFLFKVNKACCISPTFFRVRVGGQQCEIASLKSVWSDKDVRGRKLGGLN